MKQDTPPPRDEREDKRETRDEEQYWAAWWREYAQTWK
jgi:hypothetical protein